MTDRLLSEIQQESITPKTTGKDTAERRGPVWHCHTASEETARDTTGSSLLHTLHLFSYCSSNSTAWVGWSPSLGLAEEASVLQCLLCSSIC